MSNNLAKGVAVLLSRSRSIVYEKKFDLEIFFCVGWGVKNFFYSDFDKNLFLGQFGHADSESGLDLSIRALGGAREQK